MTRAEWDALIQRVEAAEGPDRELDAAIFVLVEGDYFNAPPWRYLGDGRWNDDSEPYGHNVIVCPRYTASLDAAASLVPSGWRFVGVTYIPVRRLWHCTLEAPDGGIVRGIAKTEQGARTAAALRAHKAMEGEG